MIICTMCERIFQNDEELKFFGLGDLPSIKDHEESFKGCPHCETDEFLRESNPSYDDLLLFVNSVKTYLDPETDDDERGDPNDLLKWANSITG